MSLPNSSYRADASRIALPFRSAAVGLRAAVNWRLRISAINV